VCECNGTGKCQWCGGSGVHGYIGFGEPDEARGDCNICDGSGECQLCFGELARTEPYQARFDSGDCVMCGAQGRCSSCHGSGCSFCHNTGVCQSCGGSGSDGYSEDDSEADHEHDSLADFGQLNQIAELRRTAELEDRLQEHRPEAITKFLKGAVVGGILGGFFNGSFGDIVVGAILFGTINLAFAKNKSHIFRGWFADSIERDLKRKGRLTPSINFFEAVRKNRLYEIRRWIEIDSSYLKRSPLESACFEDAGDAAKLLIELGADIEAYDSYGRTPLQFASLRNAVNVARLLIEYGAEIEACDEYGQTSLTLASYNSSADVARLLIESGADIEASDKAGRTPLHYAASGNSLDVAKLLIEHGANPDGIDLSWMED